MRKKYFDHNPTINDSAILKEMFMNGTLKKGATVMHHQFIDYTPLVDGEYKVTDVWTDKGRDGKTDMLCVNMKGFGLYVQYYARVTEEELMKYNFLTGMHII